MESDMNPTVIVTGAAGGIGSSVVAKFLADGRHVTAIDHNANGLAALAEACASDQLHTAVVDITSEDGVTQLRDDVRNIGLAVTGLINNAGIMHGAARLDHVPLAEWRHVIDVNLTGTFLCMRAFVDQLIAHHGAIVNVSSVVGLVPGPMRGSYSPSKAAIVMLTKQAALEWAPHVRVNAVCPGLLITPMSEPQYADPAVAAGRANSVPLKRVAEITEITDAIHYLMSPQASYLTGVALPVDGGLAVSAAANISVAS
jgi:glucose 1-dehydrogenase